MIKSKFKILTLLVFEYINSRYNTDNIYIIHISNYYAPVSQRYR